MSGVIAVAIENPRRARIPDEYVLTGASMNWPMSANSMIDGVSEVHLRLRDAQERAGEVDVVATGQVHLEPRAERQERRHPALGHDLALGRIEDPREGQQERALAGAVRTDDRQRFAVGEASG